MKYTGQSKTLSDYQPSGAVLDLTKVVRDAWAIGDDILHRPWVELNDRSVIEDQNRGQQMFNAFVDESSEDPNDTWRWKGTRSIARNKGIAMHANLTANFILPTFKAQNDDDEVDRMFSEVMRDIVEWMASPTVSDYQSAFLQMVFAMETNPVTYLGAEFYEVYQKIRERKEDGTYTTKEILDEVLSGFQCPIYSASQILISNAYQRNIQKQSSIIKQRFVEKSELEAKYGEHDNWGYVKDGVKSMYNEETGLFYDVADLDHPNLVVEETYLNRRNDQEVCFINGIYFGNSDVDNNPIRHRDNRNAPKYNIVPFGFSRIGEHFFFYKSMMNALSWDNAFYDAMSEIVMNRAVLEVEMPVAVTGSDQINSDIIFPRSVATFKDVNTKITPLLPQSNMVAGFNALRETEKSITEGSVNDVQAGQLPQATQKAYSVAQAQNQAKKMIGAVGKSLMESIIKYGDLMKDIAINHYTSAEVEELVGEQMRLKYKSFFLEGKSGGNGKKIKFDEELIGLELPEEEIKKRNLKLLEESGYPDNKDDLIYINPEMFAKFKFMATADVEEMFQKNSDYWQPMLLNLKTLLAQDPYTNQEELTKEIMYQTFKSKGSKFIKKPEAEINNELPLPGSDQLGSQFQARAMSQMASGAIGS